MPSFLVPSSRVFRYDNSVEMLSGGSTSLPSRPRMSGGEQAFVPVGGLEQCDMQNSRTHLYVVVNSMGVPVISGTPPRQKTYESCTPSGAASKAFYAWWRTTDQGRLAGSAPAGSSIVPPELLERLQTMDVTQEERDKFLRDWTSVDEAQLQKRLLVRMAMAGGKTAVKNYIVSYIRNTKPNKLEVRYSIVVNPKAVALKADDPRPVGILDLESFV